MAPSRDCVELLCPCVAWSSLKDSETGNSDQTHLTMSKHPHPPSSKYTPSFLSRRARAAVGVPLPQPSTHKSTPLCCRNPPTPPAQLIAANFPCLAWMTAAEQVPEGFTPSSKFGYWTCLEQLEKGSRFRRSWWCALHSPAGVKDTCWMWDGEMLREHSRTHEREIRGKGV